MRVFLALVPPPATRDSLTAALTAVRRAAPTPWLRWVDPPRWHVTLTFLGEIADEQVDRLVELLPAVAARPALELVVHGLGRFREVLWVGVTGPGLGELAAVCAATARSVGVPVEGRPWTGHLTLARGRVGPPPAPSGAVGPLAWRADRLSLLRSPLYDEVAGWPLGPPASDASDVDGGASL